MCLSSVICDLGIALGHGFQGKSPRHLYSARISAWTRTYYLWRYAGAVIAVRAGCCTMGSERRQSWGSAWFCCTTAVLLNSTQYVCIKAEFRILIFIVLTALALEHLPLSSPKQVVRRAAIGNLLPLICTRAALNQSTHSLIHSLTDDIAALLSSTTSDAHSSALSELCRCVSPASDKGVERKRQRTRVRMCESTIGSPTEPPIGHRHGDPAAEADLRGASIRFSFSTGFSTCR